jgi:flagella basal body P-ring formation protein FlgA
MKRAAPRFLAAAIALALPGIAAAQVPAPGTPAEAALTFLDKEVSGLPGRVEVQVGEIDPRLTLAPCARIEPFLPTGARLWGRGFLGLKCTEGATWRVTVPVEVKVHAVVPVATRILKVGEAVTPADVEEREVEVSAYPPGLIADLKLVEGRVLTRAVGAGQPLRSEGFRVPPAVTSGDLVRVVLTGRGFDITVDGKAMGQAAIGEAIKVQLPTGKMVGGVLKAGRKVEVGL